MQRPQAPRVANELLFARSAASPSSRRGAATAPLSVTPRPGAHVPLMVGRPPYGSHEKCSLLCNGERLPATQYSSSRRHKRRRLGVRSAPYHRAADLARSRRCRTERAEYNLSSGFSEVSPPLTPRHPQSVRRLTDMIGGRMGG